MASKVRNRVRNVRQHYFGIGLLFPFPYPAHRRSIKAVTRLRPSIPEPKVFQI